MKDAGNRYLRHLEALGRKRSTLEDYGSHLRVHLDPFFAGKALDSITPEDVEAFMSAKRQEGKSPKSIRNWLSLLHSIFNHAQKKKWATGNPVKLVDKPLARPVSRFEAHERRPGPYEQPPPRPPVAFQRS